jgi:hypothetical protein
LCLQCPEQNNSACNIYSITLLNLTMHMEASCTFETSTTLPISAQWKPVLEKATASD